MKNIEKLQKEITFSENDFASFGIKSSAVLKAFQDISLEHANILGIGIEDIKPKKLLWVALKIKYQIIRQPLLNEVLTIETYPCEKNLLEYLRSYLIYDKSGNVIIKGVSKWAIISSETRHLVRMTEIESPIVETKPVFDERLTKMELYEPEFLADYTYKILPEDIDTNNHVNNTIYAKIIDNMLTQENRKLEGFEVDFLKETFLGERLDMFKKHENDCLKILGKICEDKVSFSACLNFKI